MPRFVPGDDRIPISDHRSGIYSIRPARKTNEEAHFVLQKAMAQGTFLSTGTCRRNRPLRSYIARKRLRGAKNIAIASEGFGRMGAWPALCLHACLFAASPGDVHDAQPSVNSVFFASG